VGDGRAVHAHKRAAGARADLDGDRLPEVLAVEESAEGKFRFFYTAPAWPEEEY